MCTPIASIHGIFSGVKKGFVRNVPKIIQKNYRIIKGPKFSQFYGKMYPTLIVLP
jgi:hypothetical protein